MDCSKQAIRLTFLILFLFSSIDSVISQAVVDTSWAEVSKSLKNKAVYKVWVKHIDSRRQTKGFLGALQDSSILIYKLSKNLRIIESKKIIDVNSIQKIYFREKGDIGRGIFYGAMTGFIAGAVSGLYDGDDEEDCAVCSTAKEKATFYGSVLSVPVALIGGIMGSGKIRIQINGDQNTYDSQKEVLLKYKL